MATLSIAALRKSFGATEVLRGIDLDVADGEFVVLVGPSGCGKSTLLRMIAGLEEIDGGELRIGGELANGVPPQRRDVAMVFQSYALFPHMTVAENIGYGAKVRGGAKAEIARKVADAAAMLDLTPYLDRKPSALSGGQRQRVAMGRALMREPKLFLFDEPLSNLDAQLRVAMRAEIRALHGRIGNTVVYVTHDQVEAMTMADRIVVMRDGRIVQVGAPLDLYARPADTFVAAFIGSPAMSFVSGKAEAGAVRIGTERIALNGTVADGPVTIGVRPEAFSLVEDGGIEAVVRVVEPMGPETHVLADLTDPGLRTSGIAETLTDLRVVVPGAASVRPGETIRLAVDPAAVHIFGADGARIGP